MYAAVRLSSLWQALPPQQFAMDRGNLFQVFLDLVINSLSSGGRARPARQRSLPRPCDRFPGLRSDTRADHAARHERTCSRACRTSRSVPARSPAAFLPPAAAAARPVPSVAAPVPVWRVSATRCLPSSNGKIVAPPPRRTKYETAICESPPKTLIHQGINSPCEVPVCNGSPVRSACDPHPLSVFTPDIGYTGHTEGIRYKPRDGEVWMCPRVGRMGPCK